MSYSEQLVDPYLLSAEDLNAETPQLAEVIHHALREFSLGMRVAVPASVHAIRGNQLADIQPLFKVRYRGDQLLDMPMVTNALVAMPMGQGDGGAWGIRYPLAINDVGLALFTDRSLDNWAQSAGRTPVDPEDARAHDISDAVFIPGLVSIPQQTKDLTNDLTITNGQAVLRAQKAGTFQLTNGTNELLDLMCQLAQSLQDTCDILANQALTNTMLGPMPFLAATQLVLNQQKSATALILAKLKTLRGS